MPALAGDVNVIVKCGSPWIRPEASDRGRSAFRISFGAALRTRLTMIDLSDVSYGFDEVHALAVCNWGFCTHQTPLCSALGLK